MAAPTAAWTFLPDVLEEHLEELGFLWARRARALTSPEETPRTVRELEERIQAHLQGVLVVAHRALDFIAARLGSDDGQATFAAAFSLLHLRRPELTARVLDAFEHAEGERLTGLRQALSHGPAEEGTARLWALLDSQRRPLAAAAAQALAFRSQLRLTRDQLAGFLSDPDAGVRVAGWRLAGYLGAEVDPHAYAAAMRDDEAVVRRAALRAGAWCGLSGVLWVLRQLAERPSPDRLEELLLLAALAEPTDAPVMRKLGECSDLGPGRFRVLATCGNPALVDLILAGLKDPDPEIAAAAGAAYQKMTGFDVASGKTARAPAADEFEAEFADEFPVPDADRVLQHWRGNVARYGSSTRLARGVDLNGVLDGPTFATLDMETRWETFLRHRFNGRWSGSPLQLEVFPLLA